MAIRSITTVADDSRTSGAVADIFDKNLYTTVGIAVAGSTAAVAVVAGAATIPAVIVPGAIIGGGLIYAGHKDHVGEYLLPFLHDDDEKAARKRRSEKAQADKASAVSPVVATA